MKGEACGIAKQLISFQKWLSTIGSPKSRIDRIECTDMVKVQNDPFNGVFIKKIVQFSNGTQWATTKTKTNEPTITTKKKKTTSDSKKKSTKRK